MIVASLAIAAAWAGYPADVARCLSALDVACAEEVLERLDAESSMTPASSPPSPRPGSTRGAIPRPSTR